MKFRNKILILKKIKKKRKRQIYFIYFSTPEDDYSSPPIVVSSSHPFSRLNRSGACCQVCQKTKFVNEESSRQCSKCHKRFCANCGIRLKPQYYLCNPCKQKQEPYFSSTTNISKQYSSDYILSQNNFDENQMNHYGANQKYISPKLKISNDDDDVSSPESVFKCDNKNRLIPDMRKDKRSINILRDFQYHSLEERESALESTLKDSGIDTASSSTILNVISTDQFKKVFII